MAQGFTNVVLVFYSVYIHTCTDKQGNNMKTFNNQRNDNAKQLKKESKKLRQLRMNKHNLNVDYTGDDVATQNTYKQYTHEEWFNSLNAAYTDYV